MYSNFCDKQKYVNKLPIKGRIYIVEEIIEGVHFKGLTFYKLEGFNQILDTGRIRFDSTGFRDINEIFADQVLENIKEQIKELEVLTL